MQPFTTILFIDDCTVEYRVTKNEGSDLLVFTPVQMQDNCETPPIFYVSRKEDEWTVLNMNDKALVAQVLDKLYMQHVDD